jgi:tRNA A58 N-methylase Trm61
MGGDVSRLIDTGTGSPNLSAARAVFQRGIMECMEGDDQAANTHYREVAKLLGKNPQKTPAAPPKS